MLVFYLISIAVTGILVPILVRSMTAALTTAAVFAALFLKPMLADSVAGEREHRTLETLLSAPIHGSALVGGKTKFCICFAAAYFGLSVFCGALTSALIGIPIELTEWQWPAEIHLAILNFSAISIVGVYASATSGDMRVANNRISRTAYSLGLLFAIYQSVITSTDSLVRLIIYCALLLIYLSVILTFTIKVNTMKQSDYYENIKTKNNGRKQHKYASSSRRSRSQFRTVLGFELKYMLTLKMLLLNFGLLCFAPALLTLIVAYYQGSFDLNYAVFVTVFMIPRVPTNLIAYSIGGEKVYKTGESLLSTPLHIKSIFLAKCMVPILLSIAMLIVSFLLTFVSAGVARFIMPDIPPILGFNAGQLMLLFPVSMMASMMMMFLSAILSVALKVPRHGLYATSILSIVFLLPVLAIVYLSQNILLWSVIYAALLMIGNAICIKSISDRITRPQVMGFM